jgi:hypothetical protein
MSHGNTGASDPADYDSVVDGYIYSAYLQLTQAKCEIEATFPMLCEFAGEHSKAINQVIVIDATLELLDEII